VAVQGIVVATGLQKRFDWAGVAVSAVVGGVSDKVGRAVGADPNDRSLAGVARNALAFSAGATLGAAARASLSRVSFKDSLNRALPDVIGQTIGAAIGGRIAEGRAGQNTPPMQRRPSARAPLGPSPDRLRIASPPPAAGTTRPKSLLKRSGDVKDGP
jgi:hypothetical protein